MRGFADSSADLCAQGVCICGIMFLTGASDTHNDSFPLVLSFSSFCALHHFRRPRSALFCYLLLVVPVPLPSFLRALPIHSAPGGHWVSGGGGGHSTLWSGPGHAGVQATDPESRSEAGNGC